jgi:hypothetical protein
MKYASEKDIDKREDVVEKQDIHSFIISLSYDRSKASSKSSSPHSAI